MCPLRTVIKLIQFSLLIIGTKSLSSAFFCQVKSKMTKRRIIWILAYSSSASSYKLLLDALTSLLR